MRTVHVFQKPANKSTKKQTTLSRYYPRDHKLDRKTWQVLLKARLHVIKATEQKSMNASEKKGDESEVRRKLRIIIEKIATERIQGQ